MTVLRGFRNLARLFGILRTLARHNALFPLDALGLGPVARALVRLFGGTKAEGRPGERLAQALQALGPSFIKFGQMLATRPDLIGETLARDLSELQDRLPPFDGAEARRTVEAELEAPIDALFEHFETAPIAAASIAQVHFATTTDGREVAVKVLRPGIEAAFARDLDLYYWLAAWVERLQPALRRLRPVEVVRTLDETVAIEMDLRFEAAAASELRENLARDEGFRAPEVDWRRTAKRVLTIARVEGIRIDDREALVAAGHDPREVIAKAARSFFNQVFRDGFFHADLHPGNLFVDANGDIVAVDFGIMGRLDAETRRYLAEMLLGFLTGDYARVADVHFEAGYVPATKSRAAFTQACRSIGEPLLDRPLNEISIARLLGQLFAVTETFDMETQPQLLLLQKNMVLAEAIGRRLDPEANIWALAQPLIEHWVRENLGPEARLRDAAAELLEAARRLPRLVAALEATVGETGTGGLRLHPESLRALGGDRAGRAGAAFWIALLALALALLALG